MITAEKNPPVPPVGLSPANLTLPKEGTYFVFVLILSILFWVLLAVSMVGLIYAVFIGFFVWLGNGLLIAYLRSEAVRVSGRQLPDLHTTFAGVCHQLGVTQPPSLYVLQAGGMLNAFATRFSGRDFVVVYSDFLEALGPSSPEMKFILGHELGHIKSRHILKQIFLAPGLFFPLAGPAYRRAWESSCDRYGAFAAQDVGGSVRAMMILGGGRQHGPALNATTFASQLTEERGFFVSLHELTSTYPTLSRRVTDLLALGTGAASTKPPRNPFAYLVGLFIPGGNVGGGGGPVAAMMMVVVIGLMAAMAIPAFQKVRQASLQKACFNQERMLAAAFDQFRLENTRGAKTWDEVVGPDKLIKTMPACLAGGKYTADYDENNGYDVSCSVHGSYLHPKTASGTTP
ncbi:MAG: M48 family metalloprotease [Opitutae bacterium]|nr:M48 family metalloprotease [Opitutae bacterium]